MATELPAERALPALAVGGAPGAGKSVLGRALARRAGAALLDQDSLTGALSEVVGALLVELGRVPASRAHDLSHPALAAATRTARYEALLAAAEDCLAAGTPVVLVAPFTAERADPAAWAAAAVRLGAAGAAPVLVWATAPAAVLRQRLVQRGLPRDAAAVAAAQGQPAVPGEAGPEPGPPASPHVAVDTSVPVTGAALDEVLRRCGVPTIR